MIFGYMRTSFLDYLRNLTPQILLFSTAVFMGTRLDFNKIDLSNWLMSLVFLSALVLFIASLLANAYVFTESFKSLPEIDQLLKNIHLENVSRLRRTTKILLAPFKSVQFLIEATIFILVFLCGNVAVFLSAFKIVSDLISKT